MKKLALLVLIVLTACENPGCDPKTEAPKVQYSPNRAPPGLAVQCVKL